jgi:dTDP-4-amino-4,6-dideoxygalactose transaminase
VVAVLRSDWLTQGPAVPAFEEAMARYCKSSHAVAVNSATSALHIACLALGVGPGDLVWTSPNTFVASANCARYCGADVDFVDIDPGTLNMCPEQLAAKLATRCVRLFRLRFRSKEEVALFATVLLLFANKNAVRFAADPDTTNQNAKNTKSL